MSPKDVAAAFDFETTDFDVREHISRPTHDWDVLYPDDPDRHLYPTLEMQTPYPQASTIEERIQMRKERIARDTVLIDTPWGVRPA